MSRIGSGAGGAGAGADGRVSGQESGLDLACVEARQTRRLVLDGEATWHSRSSYQTVNATLLQWRAAYFRVSVLENVPEKYIEKAIRAFDSYVKAEQNAGLTRQWQVLRESITEPRNEFDRVASLSVDGEKKPFYMSLGEVFALVYYATIDSKRYVQKALDEQRLRGDAKRKEVLIAKEAVDLKFRLLTLANAIITLNTEDKRCHLGVRHDLVGVLNGVYPGIHIIVDIDSFIMAEIKQAVLITARDCGFDIEDMLYEWVQEGEMPVALQAQLTVEGSKELETLRTKVMSACEQAGMQLDAETSEKLEGFLHPSSLVSLPAPIGNRPALYALSQLQSMPMWQMTRRFQERVEPLNTWLAKNWVGNEKTYQRINDFLLVARADMALYSHRAALLHWDTKQLSARLLCEAESIVEFYYTRILAELEPATLSEDGRRCLEAFNSAVLAYQRDPRTAMVENFFASYFLSEGNANEQARLNRLLFDPVFREKIWVDNDLARSWLGGFVNVRGELAIDQVNINRLFLTALLSPSKDWGLDFYRLLEATWQFVQRGFDPAARGRGAALALSSYPEILRQQLCYAIQRYQLVNGLPLSESRVDVRDWPIFTPALVNNYPTIRLRTAALGLRFDDLDMAPQRLRDLFVSLSPWRRESAFVELSRQRSWDAVEHLVACYDSRAIARRALLSRARAQVIEAVRLGDEKGVRWLINFGVSANVVSRAGRSSSLLHYAVRSNHYAVAKLLLLSGAKVNAQDVDGRSPLYHAVFSSDVDMTRLLLQNGADVKTMDTQGCNALMVAVGNQHLDIVKLLLSAGADPAAYSKSISHIDSQLPLFIAVTEGNMEIFECLLAQEECRINLCDVRTGNSLLMHAIEQGRLVMVWELLHHPDHLDVLHKNHKGMTALQFSVDKGFLDVARYLLANGARPNLTDGLRCSAWDRALEKYAYEWIELFWQAGADVAQRSHRDGSTIFTCLNAIICQEDSRVNQCLVKLYNKGFVPTPVDLKNVKNFRFRYRRYLRGHTISHQILMKCQHRTDAAEALLQAAKDGNVAKVRERLAVYRKEGRDASDPQEQDVRPLLNYRNVASMSPLMWAAHHGSLSVAQVLVEAGANINLSGPRGRTALYYAARAGHLPMVQFLLKQGANFAQKSDFDFSALDVAERYGREKIVRFLQIVAKLPADSCQLVRQSPAKLRVQPSLSQLFAHQVGGEMAGGAETKREEVRRPSPSRFDRFT